MQEKVKARLRELAPRGQKEEAGFPQRNLAFAFSCMSVCILHSEAGFTQPLGDKFALQSTE